LSSESPASLTPVRFRSACARFPTGITVVTVFDAGGAPHGMTANSFTSVSLDPPLVLVCIDLKAKLVARFHHGTVFGINVLGQHQQELSVRFARKGADRFAGVDWTRGESGAPLLPGALATLECVVTQVVDAGDHRIVIGAVRAATWRDGRPLVYFNSGYAALEASG